MTVSELVLGETLIDAAAIAARVASLAREIEAVYGEPEQPLVLVCVLKGSLFFTADLARALRLPVELDAIAVRSYGDGTVSSGTVELVKDIGVNVAGRDVLLIEDIVDTGTTTAFLFDHIERHHPRSLRLVSLLNKEGRRTKQVRVDFSGFEIPDRFVVGYGLDVGERHRNLPDIRTIAGH